MQFPLNCALLSSMIIRIASMIIYFNSDLLISLFARLFSLHRDTFCEHSEKLLRLSSRTAQSRESFSSLHYRWRWALATSLSVSAASFFSFHEPSSSFFILSIAFLLVSMMNLSSANCYCCHCRARWETFSKNEICGNFFFVDIDFNFFFCHRRLNKNGLTWKVIQ